MSDAIFAASPFRYVLVRYLHLAVVWSAVALIVPKTDDRLEVVCDWQHVEKSSLRRFYLPKNACPLAKTGKMRVGSKVAGTVIGTVRSGYAKTVSLLAAMEIHIQIVHQKPCLEIFRYVHLALCLSEAPIVRDGILGDQGKQYRPPMGSRLHS